MIFSGGEFGGYGNTGSAWSLFSILFVIIFVVVIGVIIFSIVKGISQYSKNSASPVLSVEAKVVTKRTSISHHAGGANDNMNTHSHTSYYVTFQVESNDRMEFSTTGEQYGMLAEGDIGKLTFQGTRYLKFERQ